MKDRRSLISLAGVALAVTLLAPSARAEPPAPSAFDATSFNAAVAAGKPVLVDITAGWCPTCRAQKAVFADLLQEPRYAGLTIFEVDFDTRKDVVRAFGAQRQSTLIVFAEGREVGRSVGETRRKRLAALLDSAY